MRHLLKSSRLDQLIIDHKLPVWERLHGLWKTLPNFNPIVASSEPGQDLEGQARELLFPSRRDGDHVGEAEAEDIPEEDAEVLDMEDGFDGDAPDQV